MKHSIVMLMVLLATVPWTFFNPFVGLATYYGLAVLRPQALWAWNLEGIDWRFSLVVGIATLLACAVHRPGRSPAARRWPVEKLLVGALVVAVCVSYAHAVDRSVAGPQFQEFLKIFVMFFVACALLDRRARLQTLAVVIVATAGYVALEYNLRYLLHHQVRPESLRFDTLDNNGLAALMVMAMPFCLFVFARDRRPYVRWPALGALMLMMHLVFFSFSRGGMLGMLVVLPAMLLRMKRRAVGWALIVCLAAAGAAMAGPQVRARLFSIHQYELDDSAQARLAAWRTAQKVIADHPLAGVGPRNFTVVAHRYPDARGGTVHNQFLQTAADMGLPAAVALAGLIVGSLLHLQRLRRRHRGDPLVTDLAGCLQASLLGYVAVGMFLSLGLIELTYITIAMVVGLRNIVAVEGRADLPAVAPAQDARPSAGLAAAAG